MNASVVRGLQRTGRALPAVLCQGLPWIALAIACGAAGSLIGHEKAAWRATDLLLSIGASAVLLNCAQSAYHSKDCPLLAGLSRRLFTYLIWWLPLAAFIGLLQWVTIPAELGLVLALLLAVIFGWLTLIPLKNALDVDARLARRPYQIVRASLASLFCLILPPAVFLLLLAPVIGTMAAVGANIDFLEEPWPSDGGPLSPAGIISEVVSAFVPLLGASCVGFYQGMILGEWAAMPTQSALTSTAN